MMFVECVDHSSIDVADGDAEDNSSHILPNSHNKCVPVIESHRYITVSRCEIHVSSRRTCFKRKDKQYEDKILQNILTTT